MEKTILISGREVPFKATAATVRVYREKFNRDIFADFAAMTEGMNNGSMSAISLECFENIAYVMAKQADPNVPDDPDEWLDQFEMLSIYEVLPQIMELWGLNIQTLETPKKKVRRQSAR